jgi:hypothetical protein
MKNLKEKLILWGHATSLTSEESKFNTLLGPNPYSFPKFILNFFPFLLLM